MPTTVYIEGAEEAPSEELPIGTTEGSVDIIAGAVYLANEGLGIRSDASYLSNHTINVRKNDVSHANHTIDIGSSEIDQVIQGLDVITGVDFLILIDAIQEELSPENVASDFIQMEGRLAITPPGGGSPANPKIKSFTFSVPTGRLGSTLNVRLANPADVASVPPGANIDFGIEVTVNGVTTYVEFMTGGKLQARDNQMAMAGDRGPADELSFGAIDVIADKFSLGPRRPVTLYDPTRVSYHSVQTRNDQLIRSENRGLIQPRLESAPGLTMKQILSRAYVSAGSTFMQLVQPGTISGTFQWPSIFADPALDEDGCGFSKVITNIPDYQVRRADFTIESGWHSGAQPVVAMYAPVYFVYNNILFILDVERPLPAGITAHQVPLSIHKSLSERIEFKPETNAILLTYQYNANDPSEDPQKVSRDVFTDEVVSETGSSGQAGYSRTTVRRWDREFYITETPEEVLDVLPIQTVTETVQTIVAYDDTGTGTIVGEKITHQETIDYTYDGDLKTGHHRVTKAAVADPGDNFSFSLRTIEEEDCHITWAEDINNPGIKLQTRVLTDRYEVCAYESVTETYDDPNLGSFDFVRMIPLRQALASGIVTDTWSLSSLIPVVSIRETLQNMKGNQYDVEVVETDYLNNTVKRSFTQPTTGTVSNDPYEAKSRTVLIRDTDSEEDIGTRIPESVNAYELPRQRALELGRRALYRLKNPLWTLPVSLPAIDYAIRQGSVIQGQKRSGTTSKYFVTGYTINGESLGQAGHKISQTVEAVEIADEIT